MLVVFRINTQTLIWYALKDIGSIATASTVDIINKSLRRVNNLKILVTCEERLKGLPCLTYEIKFEPRIVKYKNGKTDSPWHMKTLNLPAKERAKARSKTFPGIAAAMADQWTNLV